MIPKTRQQAWISGLPSLDEPGGIPFEALPLLSPKPDARSLSLTIFASKDLVFQLQSLSANRTKVPNLSLVVRTDPVKESDDQYLMNNTAIDAVISNKVPIGSYTINLLFQSITIKMGVSMNPGPPVDHLPVQPTGVNTGWIFGLPNEDIKHGEPLEIVDFAPPSFDRQMVLTVEKTSTEMKCLAHSPSKIHELILILPDRAHQRYIEFKLWDAKISSMENERRVVFESDFIECLTGEDNWDLMSERNASRELQC